MDAHRPNQHWVLIETGGIQQYIFASNRLRHVVGASQLIDDSCRTWVDQAVRDLGLDPAPTVVMRASGKTMLLVDDAEVGRKVIRRVTARALREAPGLRITGAISGPFDRGDVAAYQRAFKNLHRRCAQARAERPDLRLRDRVMPWHRLCRDTGLPAARQELYGEDEPAWASAGLLARSSVRRAAAKRLSERFGEHQHLLPRHLDTLLDDGWMAVIHADGNGVGGLFREFAEHVTAIEGGPVPLDTYVAWQREIAEQLDEATGLAFTEAIGVLTELFTKEHSENRLLPLVIGGDDVTVICAAELAIPFVRAFAAAFQKRTGEQPRLSQLAGEATGRTYLTASAGIAIVKQHHPLANAYQLAEDLVRSAKRCKTKEPSESGRQKDTSFAAFDFHIVNDSTRNSLSALRDSGPGNAEGSRHAGPYALGAPDELPEELKSRSVKDLTQIVDWLASSDWLSSTQAHALRDAADRSLDEYRHLLGRVLGRANGDRSHAERLLSVPDDGGGPLRLFDALALAGLRKPAPDRPAVETSNADSDTTAAPVGAK